MKTRILSALLCVLCVLCASALIGCGHKPDARDAEIESLKQRVRTLEEHVDKNTKSINNWQPMLDAQNAALEAGFDSDSADFALLMNTSDRVELLDKRITKLETAPVPRTAAATTPRPPPAATMKDGVPVDVYNQIRAKIERDWPTDYSLQVTLIKSEIEAYKKLHP